MNTYWKTNPYWGWSYSKQRTFESCKKGFFFQSIAQYEPEPLKSKVKRIKALNLSKFNFIKGQVVHKAIAKYLDSYRQGDAHSPEETKASAMTNLDFILADANNKITEVYNGATISDQKIYYLKSSVEVYLDNFFREIWPNYVSKKIVFIEGDTDFPTFNCGGCKVYVMPDLVTTDTKDKGLVTDWKGGGEKWGDDPEESVQLTCYVYWASQTFGIPPGLLNAEFIYLEGPTRQTTQRDMESLEEFTTYVNEKVNEMIKLNEISEFTPSPDAKTCKDCNFATICKEGKVFL